MAWQWAETLVEIRGTDKLLKIPILTPPLGWMALKTPTTETPGFSGHVTTLTLQYLWPRPPGVWLGGPDCKPGHSGWSKWSPTIKIASGLIPVMHSISFSVYNFCTNSHINPLRAIFFRRNINIYLGQVTKLWLSCYLVLLSIDNKTR